MVVTLTELVEEYNRRATVSDCGWFISSWPTPRMMRDVHRLIAQRLGPGRFIDLGCGPGDIVEHFPDRQADYHGIDVAPACIEVARRLYPGWRFALGDWVQPLETFEGVISAGMPGFLPLEAALRWASAWAVLDWAGDTEIPAGWDVAGSADLDGHYLIHLRRAA